MYCLNAASASAWGSMRFAVNGDAQIAAIRYLSVLTVGDGLIPSKSIKVLGYYCFERTLWVWKQVLKYYDFACFQKSTQFFYLYLTKYKTDIVFPEIDKFYCTYRKMCAIILLNW